MLCGSENDLRRGIALQLGSNISRRQLQWPGQVFQTRPVILAAMNDLGGSFRWFDQLKGRHVTICE